MGSVVCAGAVGPLAVFEASFMASLRAGGCARVSVDLAVRATALLVSWMQREGLVVASLTPEELARGPRLVGPIRLVLRVGGRAIGAFSVVGLVAPASPVEVVLHGFEGWLRVERGLARRSLASVSGAGAWVPGVAGLAVG